MLETNLKNRVIVVTGAAGRLGSRIIDRFVREEATVAAIARTASEVELISFPGHKEGAVFEADTADEAAVTSCFNDIHAQFGRIDVLIHAVGTWSRKPLQETSLSDWESLMRTNLTSAFLCFREAARHMEGRSGRLIGFSAGQGADLGHAQQAAYGASKAGLMRLVESMADEFRDTGITAHAIAPSTILYEETTDARGVRADHVVDLCVFLCSGAGAALNGKTLRAYGSAG